MIDQTDLTDLKDTGSDTPDTPTGFIVYMKREGAVADVLGPYATRSDAEAEVTDLVANGQEGTVAVLPMYPGWAVPTMTLVTRCTVCLRHVPTDYRGDVLDASGRCTQCQP